MINTVIMYLSVVTLEPPEPERTAPAGTGVVLDLTCISGEMCGGRVMVGPSGTGGGAPSERVGCSCTTTGTFPGGGDNSGRQGPPVEFSMMESTSIAIETH